MQILKGGQEEGQRNEKRGQKKENEIKEKEGEGVSW